MALSQQEINERAELVNQALIEMGITPSDQANRGVGGGFKADLVEGLEVLIETIELASQKNGQDPVDIDYDPSVGFTPEVGVQLSELIQNFKGGLVPSPEYAYLLGEVNAIKLSDANPFGKSSSSTEGGIFNRLREADVPSVFYETRDGPAKLLWLINKSETIIPYLNDLHGHENGRLINPQFQELEAPTDEVLEVEDVPEGVLGETVVTEPSEEVVEAGPEEGGGETNDSYSFDLYADLEISEEDLLLSNIRIVEEALHGTEDQPGLPAMLQKQLDANREMLEFLGGPLSEVEFNTEFDAPNGQLDPAEQAAIQNIMIVMWHMPQLSMSSQLPHLLEQGIEPWQYHPDKGEFIFDNVDKLHALMGGGANVTEEELGEMATALVGALDMLEEHGQLFNQPLIGDYRFELTDYTTRIIRDELQRNKGVEGANDLLNELVYAYTGTYLHQISGFDEEVYTPNGEPDGFEARLKEFYEKVKARHGDDEEALEADITAMLYAVTTLPVGNQYDRQAFIYGVKNALGGTAAGFAKRVAGLHSSDARSAYDFWQGDPVIHPKLFEEGLTFPSGEEPYTAQDVIDVYNAERDGRRWKPGENVPHIAMLFEASSQHSGENTPYIAAVHHDSNIFSIEEINVEHLNEIFFTKEALLDVLDTSNADIIDFLNENFPDYASSGLSQKRLNEICLSLLSDGPQNLRIHPDSEDDLRTTQTAIFSSERMAQAQQADPGFALAFQSANLDGKDVDRVYGTGGEFMLSINGKIKGPAPLDAMFKRYGLDEESVEADETPDEKPIEALPLAAPPPSHHRAAPSAGDGTPFTPAGFLARQVELNPLSDLTAELYTMPRILSESDLAVFRTYISGEFNRDKNYPLRAVNWDEYSNTSGVPAVGYYRDGTVHIIDLPPEFRGLDDEDDIADFIQATNKDGRTEVEYKAYMKERYPGLHMLATLYEEDKHANYPNALDIVRHRLLQDLGGGQEPGLRVSWREAGQSPCGGSTPDVVDSDESPSSPTIRRPFTCEAQRTTPPSEPDRESTCMGRIQDAGKDITQTRQTPCGTSSDLPEPEVSS